MLQSRICELLEMLIEIKLDESKLSKDKKDKAYLRLERVSTMKRQMEQ